MIKTLSSIAFTALSMILYTGCSKEPSTTTVEYKQDSNFQCKQEGVAAPQWTCIPNVKSAYSGVGIAPNSAAGMGHMRRVALANGRSDLAQQINTLVKDKVEVFTRATGNGSQETVDAVSTSVSKQVAKINLENSKVVDMWNAPSGALYMLVAVPEAAVNRDVKDAVRSSFKKDDALWQQFQSQQALENLEKEFPTN
ncbi:MAG: LPP20 family lipoprotein [Campylobacterales bacterium]|nr:LPP20 family lipoprotein [Campylobacterales bacterium]